MGQYQNYEKIYGTLHINCQDVWDSNSQYNKGTNVGGNERKHERNKGSVKQKEIMYVIKKHHGK